MVDTTRVLNSHLGPFTPGTHTQRLEIHFFQITHSQTPAVHRHSAVGKNVQGNADSQSNTLCRCLPDTHDRKGELQRWLHKAVLTFGDGTSMAGKVKCELSVHKACRITLIFVPQRSSATGPHPEPSSSTSWNGQAT